MVQTGVTFAEAAAEWLRFIEEDRERKPSTLVDYRSALNAHLLPAFAERPIESITAEEIEAWRKTLTGLSNRSKNKLLIQLHGIFRRAQRVWAIPVNPLARVEKHPMRPSSDIQVFSPEEVWALIRAAASELDGAIYMTAAFTGLRMGELLALRWRDVDFAGSTIRVRSSWAGSALTTPKSGKVRAVPLAPDVASALAGLGRREHWVGEDDLVFASETGSYLDGSALRRRYKAALARADLRALRFHDLRHTFGTRMIAKAGIRRVQEWMGHADIQTTMATCTMRRTLRTRAWSPRRSPSGPRGICWDNLGRLRTSCKMSEKRLRRPAGLCMLFSCGGCARSPSTLTGPGR